MKETINSLNAELDTAIQELQESIAETQQELAVEEAKKPLINKISQVKQILTNAQLSYEPIKDGKYDSIKGFKKAIDNLKSTIKDVEKKLNNDEPQLGELEQILIDAVTNLEQKESIYQKDQDDDYNNQNKEKIDDKIKEDVDDIKEKADNIENKVQTIEDNILKIIDMIEKSQEYPAIRKALEEEKKKNEEKIRIINTTEEELEKEIKIERERINRTREEIKESRKKIIAKIKDLQQKFKIQKERYSKRKDKNSEEYSNTQKKIKDLEKKVELLDEKQEEIKTKDEERLKEIEKKIKELTDELLDQKRFVNKITELAINYDNHKENLSESIKEFNNAYKERLLLRKKAKKLSNIYSEIEKKKELFDKSITEREKYEEEIKEKFKKYKRNFYYDKLFNSNSWKEKTILLNDYFNKFSKKAEYIINNLKEYSKKIKFIKKFKFKDEYDLKINVYWETKELTKEIKKLKKHSDKLKKFIPEAKNIIINTNPYFMKDTKQANDFKDTNSKNTPYNISGNDNLKEITYCSKFILYILERIDSIERDNLGYKEIYEKLNVGIVKEQKKELQQFLDTNEWHYNLHIKPALIYLFIEKLKDLSE